jgi:hypothetical protein
MLYKELLEILRDRLLYEPETGLFKYRYNYNVMKKGDIAGRINTNGHVQISINNKSYMAHNLAWLYMTGEYPISYIIDHIDRSYSNNTWSNLRKATNSLNQGNSKIRIDNKSGVKGVYYSKIKHCFIAQITINSKRTWLGYFNTIDEAKEAYEKAANKHFKEFANVN